MNPQRIKAAVRGAVQGVGFRPFVYRLACELGLAGWVMNTPQGVCLEAEGEQSPLQEFLLRLRSEKPGLAIIQDMETEFLEPVGHAGFKILQSQDHGAKRALILPDAATCGDCLREIFDPGDRRYLYPFTNCTHCGPRFSIIESLPYDRAATTMKKFVMCPRCEREYHDPASRRFHAQPNACPICGPQLELWNDHGKILGQRFDALFAAVRAVRNGQILALKGLGGFQLVVDARNEEAVHRLRKRKRREEKPFALMFPSLSDIRLECHVSEAEEQLLLSPEAPIVLLQRRFLSNDIALSVSPRNPHFGVLLPFTPLHHILMREVNFPVVATSGNLSNEPICIDEHEAKERLGGIADVFLAHNRPIVRHVDDSIARVLLGRTQILRRARGYAPLPIHLRQDLPAILAVGAHLKNTVALSVGKEVFLSQHVGDLETPQALEAFRRAAADLPRLYETTPEIIACDLHPEYFSTRHAGEMRAVAVAVQHHYAHVLACMAENELDAPVLGVSWDGTGYGGDGTIWGGEFLIVEKAAFCRFAHFLEFRLPGGETAIRQPRRTALGLLYRIFGETVFERRDLPPIADFAPGELKLLRQALVKRINAPLTCSMGRLFDSVASLLGLCHRASFEGQGAMELEFAIEPGIEAGYGCELPAPFLVPSEPALRRRAKSPPLVVNWQPLIMQLLMDVQNKVDCGIIAAKFHNTLVEIIVQMAGRAGVKDVVLTGGCFQNQYLTERSVRRLREEGFRPCWHHLVPPNDGGIALGQIMAAARAVRLRRELVEECLA